MKKTKYIIVFLSTLLISCQNKKETTTEPKPLTVKDFPKVNQNQDFIGLYLGVLPCADCEGMETKIILNENSTYTKSVLYLGKGTKIFEQKGTFSWNLLGNVIVLDGIENAPNQYLVTQGKLSQLDLNGALVDGKLSSEYDLIKQDETISEIETGLPEGDKVNLNNKLESSASIQPVNPAEGKFSLAETKWKLIKLNGKRVKQKGTKPNFIKLNSSDGRFSAFTGCNNIMGSYAMPKVNSISFSEIGATRMACADMSTENEFIHMLEETTYYLLQDETLTFYSIGKASIATFVAIK